MARRRSPFRKLIALVGLGFIVAAAARELRQPADEREWHGAIGPVPYDLRLPTMERLRDRWWNPDDPRIFTPRVFGVGWSINLAQIVGAVRPGSTPPDD